MPFRHYSPLTLRRDWNHLGKFILIENSIEFIGGQKFPDIFGFHFCIMESLLR